MKKGLLALLVFALMFFNQFTAVVLAADDGMINWGEVRTGEYDLNFPTINERSELTGYDLQLGKMTKDETAVDFHFSSGYPSFTWTLWAIDYKHGGKPLYDQELTDPVKRITQIRAELNAVAKDDVEPGDLVLLVTSNDAFAKIRIDKITATKISFSYVLEAGTPGSTGASSAPPASLSGDLIYWGEEKKGVYDFNYTLAPNERYSRIGYDLQLGKMTKDETALDFSIDNILSSGTWTLWAIDYKHGGKALYDQKLSDPVKRVTQIRAEMSATPLEDLKAGDMCLLVTSTDAFAKIRIDKITPSKVEFSYVLEAQQLTQQQPVKPQNGGTTQNQQADGIQLQIGSATAMVNGKKVPLDVSPEIINGSTMVPLRFIGEAIGAKVAWDGAERKITLTLKQDTLILWIGQIKALVNGKEVLMNTPAQIIDDTTMVPLRFVSENLKQQVSYEVSSQKITITPK